MLVNKPGSANYKKFMAQDDLLVVQNIITHVPRREAMFIHSEPGNTRGF